jgi:HEAT repeat protein
VLRGLLEDRMQRVRECALLALGASGSSQAVPFLMQLTSIASAAEEEHLQQLSPDAHALAWVALGIGRSRGFSDGVGSVLVDLAGELQPDQLRDLVPATLFYQRLSPADDLDRLHSVRLGDAAMPLDVRARSAESLGTLADPSMIRALDDALHDGDLRLRRPAALALGSFRGGALREELAHQLGVEQDELLRGYLLLAIANQESGPAAELLTTTLRTGDALVRPWSALALGLLARRDADVSLAACKTLRTEAARCRSVPDQLSFVLASGLARDETRADEFLDLLAHAKDAQLRLAAAQALTLIGLPSLHSWPLSTDVRLALKAQLAKEHDPETRGALAEALGVHHDVRDVGALLATLGDVHAGDPIADLARGCGAHRTHDMLAGLSDIVADRKLDPPVRAAAWESLGLLLDPQWGSRLPAALAGAELGATLPDWCLRTVGQSTL